MGMCVITNSVLVWEKVGEESYGKAMRMMVEGLGRVLASQTASVYIIFSAFLYFPLIGHYAFRLFFAVLYLKRLFR